MKLKIPSYLKWLSAIIVIVFFVYFLLSRIAAPIVTIYNVEAQTERLRFTTLDDNTSRFNILRADVFNYDTDQILEQFNGSLQLNNGVDIDFERISSGPVIMTITHETEESVGNFYAGDSGELILEGPAFIDIILNDVDSLLEEGISMVFPLSGKIELGRSVDFEIFGESTPLLQSGNISMTGYALWGNSYFEAGQKSLGMGDYLIFEKEDEKAYGFLTVNDSPGLQIAYRIEAKEARIIKPGPRDSDSGYPISASLYDRLVGDRIFQGGSILIATLLLIMTVITFIMDFSLFRKESNF